MFNARRLDPRLSLVDSRLDLHTTLRQSAVLERSGENM